MSYIKVKSTDKPVESLENNSSIESDEIVTKEILLTILDKLVGTRIKRFKKGISLKENDVVCDDEFNLYRVTKNIENTSLLDTINYDKLSIGGGMGLEEILPSILKEFTNG